MADDKLTRKQDSTRKQDLTRKQDATVLEDLCEKIGFGGGFLVGVVAGAVGGAIELGTRGSLDGAADRFNSIADRCIKEGGKVGRKHMPGLAFGIIFSSAIGIGKIRR
jgi:ABC-type tungstate transport system permease subunit